MKNHLYLLFLLFFSLSVLAQNENPLPINSTPEEIANFKNYVKPTPKGIFTPPVSPIRNVAEWEEMQGICISWKGYTPFLTEIVRHASEEGKVWIYCSDSNSVRSTLNSASISLTNVRCIQTSMNSVWIRDFGGNNVYTNDVDSLLMIDWVYNRSRPLDDDSPSLLANKIGVPLYECTNPPTDLVATGGNFMSDGFGTAFSSELILDENASLSTFNSTIKTEQDVRDIVSDFLGIDNYILMETLPYDDIHHIDMHMKLLDEETLLIGEYPTGISDGPQIEANIQFIQNNYTSVFGTPYKIVRIPMPPSTSGTWPSGGAYYRTYTNSLIINKKVLVPTYYEKYDTTALRIYQEAMPGYEIIGIDANDIITASGTIHCTTHEIATTNPLLISHQALPNTNDIINNYEVNALIQHKSGINEAKIWYKTGLGQSYVSVPMSLTNASNNTWTGYIPVQPSGTSVYYYIQAEANSGKTQVRPLPAPASYWKFNVYNVTENQILNADNYLFNVHQIQDNEYRITIKSDLDFKANIELVSIEGKSIQQIYNGNWDKGTHTLDFSSQNASGIYFIKLSTDKGIKTHKLFISPK